MKRECLLSQSYIGEPMIFKGIELAYSPLVNEILRSLKTAFFHGRGGNDQTEHHGICEGIMVMNMVARGEKQEIHAHINLSPDDRSKAVLAFYIDNEAEIEAIKPALVTRMESAIAASVESEGSGKPPQQPQDSSL
jgi:hypothetical protein